MPTERLHDTLAAELAELEAAGTLKGNEDVVTGVVPAADGRGCPTLRDSYW